MSERQEEMPGPKRHRRERTEEWASIKQWTLWPEQELYEQIRPLVLFLGVATCYAKLDWQSIRSRLHSMHCRFDTIFTAYQLTDFSEWNAVEHLTRYMNDPEGPDSLETRVEFMRSYTALVRTLAVYLQALPAEMRVLYQQWALPALPAGVRAQIAHDQVMRDLQMQRRKADSDAVSPFFAQIRAEAHFRWNALARLRQHYREVAARVEAGKATLPVAFSYEEPRYKQRFHFLLWDRPSFVLGHSQSYSKTLCSTARNKRQQYSPERNHFFLEFVGAESLIDPNVLYEPDALLWFGEVLRSRLIGEHANCGAPEEIERKQAFLRSWGYGERDDEEFATQPFSTGQTGLLTETLVGGQANFLTAARRKTSGLLFTIETLYDAATFGLAALDFFTTTGARANELLQLRLSPDCLYAMSVGGTPRLLVRLVPKGRDKAADYMIGPETKRNLERVGAMLKDHYQLGPGESLPHVPFNPDNQRAHRFPGKHPYLFQYHGKQLLRSAVTATLRFLCHGMIFQRADGTTVILKPHLLRRYEQVKRRDMGPETVKMQALIQRCDTELEEMNLIEEYRADETYQPDLRIESGPDHCKGAASLAPETLPGEARTHDTPGQGGRRSARQTEANSDH